MRARILAVAAWVAATAASALGQQIPFQLLVTQGQNAVTVQNGGTLTFVSTVGSLQSAQLKVTYTGNGQAVFSQEPTIFGSTEFRATIGGAGVPAVLMNGDSITVTLQFAPVNANASTAQVSLPFQETQSSGAVNNGTLALTLTGTAPSFTFSYILQADQNVVPIQNGGLIPFPSTLVGATAQAALNLTNTGSGPGAVTNVTISGSAAFRLQGKPLFPAVVAAAQNLQILVLYTPASTGADSGQITITFDTGTAVTVNVSGTGSAASFTYQIISTNPPQPVPPGGTVGFPDANVGQTSSVTIRVINSGSANGTVNSINVAGQGFQLAGPVALPSTLAPGASLAFSINFTPAQPGALTGTLIVNADTFKMAGNGLGSQLTFSYLAGGTSITLSATNPSVVFSPVQVTQSEQLSLDVKNTGTLPATISNIGAGQATGPYVVKGLPPLPVTLAPNSDFQFTIQFTPVALGFTNGTLILDATTIALVGQGTAPPPLPDYTLSGPSGNTQPRTQPNVTLTLANPYPVAVSGTLTIGVAGALPSDPAVQFSTSGRTVSFTIPANQTAALFGASGTQIGLQTGTVASTISVSPTFATQAGNVDLTPSPAPGLQFAVAPSAPVLIALQFANVTSTGFTLQATGFSTPRSLSNLVVKFTPVTGFSMPNSQFTVDLQQVSAVWFQSAGSQTFGGLFTAAVPFSFQGTVPAGTSVLSAIASVAATVSNSSGTSNSLSSAIP